MDETQKSGGFLEISFFKEITKDLLSLYLSGKSGNSKT
jgi:hypothetical protein